MIKELVRIRLISIFMNLFGKGRKSKRVSASMAIGGGVLVFALFAFYFAWVAYTLSVILIPLGLDAAYFAIFNILAFGIVFMLSVFETKSDLFECRDNELLLSMPIRPRDIVLSRSVAVTLLNAAETLAVLLPTVIVYALSGGNPWNIPTALISGVLLSLVATVLSVGVGYLVAAVSAKFKNNSAVTVTMSIGFFVLFFVLYSTMMDALAGVLSDAIINPELVKDYVSPILFLGRISMLDPIYLPIFIVVSIGIIAAAWLIISKNYIKIITSARSTSKKKYVKRALSGGSAFAALARKELSFFFSSAMYILNGASGAIIQLILAFALLFSGADVLEVAGMLGLSFDSGMLPVVATALLVGISSITSISASALSLEGKSFWILKSSPIRSIDVICAKLVPHLVIMLPSSLISSIIIAIAIKAAPVWWLVMIPIPLLATVAFAMLGLILNIAMPCFDFDNITKVVKQSMPVFALTFGGMILTAGIVALAFAASMSLGSVVAALILCALVILLFLGLFLILTGPSKRRLERLS